MESTSVLIMVTGKVDNNRIQDILNACVKVFEKRKIDLIAECVAVPGIKSVHDTHKQIYGSTGLAAMWIMGLDPNIWWGTELEYLLSELKEATGVNAYAASN